LTEIGMRRLALGLLALLGLLGAAHADCNTADALGVMRAAEPRLMADAERRARAIPNGTGLFWRVERAGTAPSYLFGTIHMSDSRVTTLAEPVRAAILASRVVALELPPENRGDIADAIAIAVTRMRASGRDLRALVSDADWAAVDRALLDASIDPFTVRFLPPALTATQIATAPCEQRLRRQGRQIQDNVIRDLALGANVRVIGLERPEEQIRALTSQPFPDQVRMLVQTARGRPAADVRADFSIGLYLERRPSFLIALAEAANARRDGEGASGRAFLTAIFDRRNRVMRDRALPLLREGGAFIAVGAGHLAGSSGLVQGFRNAGYRVTRLD
jgi:hypothetical protein